MKDKGILYFLKSDVTIDDKEFYKEYFYSEQTVEEYKKYLIDIQDKKTEELILSGFTFDGNLFSLSINAQINWSNLLNIPQVMFPLNLSTKDDKIYILNFNNLQNFYFTALGIKNECLQLGNLIKKRINECGTTEELDLIKLEIWA